MTHGKHDVVQVLVLWTTPQSQFTLLFERSATDMLQRCTVSGATWILWISWDEL